MSSKSPWEEVKEAWVGKEVMYNGVCPYCAATTKFYRQAIASLRLTFHDSWAEIIGHALSPKRLALFAAKRAGDYVTRPVGQTAICPSCDRRVSKCPKCGYINECKDWKVVCGECKTTVANY